MLVTSVQRSILSFRDTFSFPVKCKHRTKKFLISIEVGAFGEPAKFGVLKQEIEFFIIVRTNNLSNRSLKELLQIIFTTEMI